MVQSSNNIWQIQANTKGRIDFDFFVTTNNKYGIYFSKIDEYGMMKFISPVQIWTDKENPRLIFQSREIKFEYQQEDSCYYLEKSDIIILLTPCVYEKHCDLLYVLFDFNKSLFALINAPNFLLTEVNKGVVQQEIDFRYAYDDDTKFRISQDNRKSIDLASLEWHSLEFIDIACSFVTYKNTSIGK